MQSGKNGERPYLISYDLVRKLPIFFNHIGDEASNYKFIAVAARRCFNLCLWYFEESLPENLTSFNGLLLQYKQIADYYRANQRFPKILLVDDIMFHGRSLAKTINHLEELVYRALSVDQYSINRLRRDFSEATHIYVYARGSRTLMLEERFWGHFRWDYKLRSGDLRDMSFQLSDVMTRWGIANTSFVPSIRLDALSKKLDDQNNNCEQYGDWQCVNWFYDREKMVVACKMMGRRRINRISTIRFCPARDFQKSPWITSFTMLGKMKYETLNKLCAVVLEKFNDNRKDGSAFVQILEAKEASLQHIRGQMISFIVSAIDLSNFIRQVGMQDAICHTEDDINKIARNFSVKDTKLTRILRVFLREAIYDDAFQKKIESLLDENADAIINLSNGNDWNTSRSEFVVPKERIDQINRIVLDVVYRMGINAENRAFTLKEKPYLFKPNSFQDYEEYYHLKFGRIDDPEQFWNERYIDNDFYDIPRFGRDGVLSLYSLFDLIRKKALDYMDFDAYAHLFLASFIMLIDIGIMGSMPQISSLNISFLPLAKAGELATFFFPRTVAPFVPAFAIIESKCYRIGLSEKKAVTSFYESILPIFCERKKDIEQQYGFRWSEGQWEQIVRALPDVNNMGTYTELLYRAGQSFRGWDFPNLCYPGDSHIQECQMYLKKEAEAFLQF